METNDAVAALAALAHPGRLAIFRLLVQAGPGGLAAGVIAGQVGAAPNTLSANLTVLANAGLIGAVRDGRRIIYSVRYARMSDLLVYLTEDCCQGRPEIRGPLAAAAASPPCCSQLEGVPS